MLTCLGMREMSDMDYEKAWKDLKYFVWVLAGVAFNFAESEAKKRHERLKAQGGEIVASQILKRMDMMEKMDNIGKEMTTVGEDDGQKVQD